MQAVENTMFSENTSPNLEKKKKEREKVNACRRIMLSERNYHTRPQKGLIGLQRVTYHLKETIALDLGRSYRPAKSNILFKETVPQTLENSKRHLVVTLELPRLSCQMLLEWPLPK